MSARNSIWNFVRDGRHTPHGFTMVLSIVSGFLIAFFGVACVLLAWAQSCNPHQFLKIMVAALMIASASVALGAFLGFLFALPRYQQPRYQHKENELESRLPSYLDNTNLLDVSDWLTKIIVGLGLVQITRVPSALVRLGRSLAPALGYLPSDKGSYGCATAVTTEDAIASIAIAICLSAFVSAFMSGYLWTRVTLTHSLRNYEIKALEETNSTKP
jgi:hypothetical protein